MPSIFLFAFACAASITSALHADDVLYDYAPPIHSGGVVGSREFGHAIRLTQDATLTKFTFYGYNNRVQTLDFMVRFYTTPSLSSAPADLIWSGLIEDVTLPLSFGQGFSIDVPNVPVPRVLAFTVEPLPRQSFVFSEGNFTMPVGQPGTHMISRINGNWELASDISLAIRIEGTPGGILPEPGAAVIGFWTISGVLAFRRRRR